MIEDAKLVKFHIHLTQRQREVAQLASEGLSNQEIGKRLYIASSVVAGHLTNIYEEMGILDEFAHLRPNRFHLIRLFVNFFNRHPVLDNFNAASS